MQGAQAIMAGDAEIVVAGWYGKHEHDSTLYAFEKRCEIRAYIND